MIGSHHVRWRRYLLPVAALWVALMACAPRATPIPAPAAPPAPSALPVPASPAIGAAEAAWQRLEEAARREGKLTAYSYHLVGDVGLQVSRAFSERYGIALEVVSGAGSVLLERLKAEQRAGQMVADLFTTSVSIILTAKQAEVTEAFGSLPVLGEEGIWVVSPRADPDGHILSFAISMTGPHINTNLLKKEDYPRSYFDLLQPRWKGKLSIGDPASMPAPNDFFWIMTSRKILGMDYFQGLAKQGIRLATTSRENASLLARGSVALAIESELTMALVAKEGAPTQFLDMEEGIVVGAGSGMSVVRKAPHPAAARVFANWLLSREGQEVLARAQGSNPIRYDVPSFSPLGTQLKPKRPLVITPADQAESSRIMRERVFWKLLTGGN